MPTIVVIVLQATAMVAIARLVAIRDRAPAFVGAATVPA
jgi:hypothetical protein